MALTFVNSATVVKDSGSGTTLTCNVPASTANGDLMLLALLCIGSSWTLSSGLTGWTQIQEATGAANAIVRIYQRTANTEPASYTPNLSSTARAVAGILSYRGHDTTTPVNAINNSAASTTATAYTSPSVTTTDNDCFLLTFVGCRVPSSLPSSWTNATGTDAERFDITTTGGTTNAGLAMYGSATGLAVGTYDRSLTCGNSYNQVSSISIALKPAALSSGGSFTGWGIPI